MQPGLNTPIDDQGFTRCPQPRPATPMMITTPLRLHLRHQPAEVARRPHIASRLGRRQQPLRRNPARRPGDPFSHQIRHPIEVPAPRLPLRLFTRLMCLDDLLHRLVGSAAHPSRTPIRAHISVGSKHIHPFPRVLHNGDPPSAVEVTGSHRHREPRKGAQRQRHDERRMGTFIGHQRGSLPGHQWGLFHGHGQLAKCWLGIHPGPEIVALYLGERTR